MHRSCWLLLLGLPACLDSNSHYLTASGRWKLSMGRLAADPEDLPGMSGEQQNEPLLVGSRWCPEISSSAERRAKCFAGGVDGPAQLDGECIELTGAGSVTWRFDRIACDDPAIFLPEQVRLRAVAADEVEGRLVPYLDAMGRRYLVGDFPESISPADDATLIKLAADQPVRFAVNLLAGDRRVAWDGERATLAVETLAGEPPTVALAERATISLQAPAGSEAALSLVVGPSRVALGRIRGVGLDELAELEVVVAYFEEPEVPRQPQAARAVARDREGDLVYGARAEWEVLAGSFPFAPVSLFGERANFDYTTLSDFERDPGESNVCYPTHDLKLRHYTGRIAAHVGGLSAEAELAWSYQYRPDLDTPFAAPDAELPPSSLCQGPGFDELTCACDSGPGPRPAFGSLALLSLGTALCLRRRARRRDR